MLAEFEAPHRLSWESLCQHYRGHPETLLQATIVHILSRTATFFLRGCVEITLLLWHTSAPGGQAPPKVRVMLVAAVRVSEILDLHLSKS